MNKGGKMKKKIKILTSGKSVQEVASLEGCCLGKPSATK